MQAIYEPKGKALEYCERAVNLYRGCGHGCGRGGKTSYCYAPRALRMTSEAFGQSAPRPGVIEAIRKEAPKHAGHSILMCFSTDPFQPINDEHRLAEHAINELHAGGCHVVVLTKGGKRSAKGLSLLIPGDKYGVTLTFDNDADSLTWEPRAALPGERIEMLRQAKAAGIETWASLEPVIDPEQSLELIRSTAGIVDVVKIGKLNHHKLSQSIDWPDFAQRVVETCEAQGSAYVLKKDLAIHLRSAA